MSGRIYLCFIISLLICSVPIDLYGQSRCDGCGSCTPPSVADNSDLGAACGQMNIAFILDESSSIGPEFEPDVRSGVNSFLNALNCTGAKISFIEFNTSARLVSVTNGSYEEIDDGLISQVDGYFNGGGSSTQRSTYSPPESGEDGYTNWEDALLLVEELSSTPDLILFFTDGNPTAINGPSSPFGMGDPLYCENESSLTNAMIIANDIKNDSDDPHIFMLGVGTSIDEENLRQISGFTEYQPGFNDIGTSDWFVEEDFDNLASCLRAFARNLCPLCPDLMDLTIACDEVPDDLFQAAGGTRESDCGEITVDYTFTHPGACGGTQTVVFTVTDDNGTTPTFDDLVEQCSIDVTVQPADAPPPLQCAALPSINCGQAEMADVSDYGDLTSSNGLSGDCALTITAIPSDISTMNLACDGSGMLQITYTVTDNCGGTYDDFICMQTVTAATIPAQPSCPMLPALTCTQAADAVPDDYLDLTSTAGTGVCRITKTGVPTSIDKSAIACDGSGSIVITFEVTDNCGNSYPDVVCMQTVMSAPIPIQPSCPTLDAITCVTAAAAEPSDYMSMTSTSGEGICQITKTGAPSSIDKSTIACDGSGFITITYTVTDNCGNTYANVLCTQNVMAAPVPGQPSCLMLPELTCAEAEAAMPGDYGNLTSTTGVGICEITKTAVPSAINKDNIACGGGGTIAITYAVTDNCGNSYADVVCVQSVAAVPLPSQPNCPTLADLTCAQAAAVTTSDYTNITSSVGSGSCLITKTGVPSNIDKSQIACDGSGTISITYMVTDNCGNAYADVVCQQSVQAAPIPDQPACPSLPAISCAAAVASVPSDYDDITSVAGTGICMITKTGEASSIDKSQIACDGSGIITITYTVTDNCGNTYPDVECEQVVQAAPIPGQPVCPTLSVITCSAAAAVEASDYSNITSTAGSGACQIIKTGVPSSIDKSGIACDGSGSITIIYTVTDNCGRTYADVQCMQSVTAAPIPDQPTCPTLEDLSCAEAAAAQPGDYENLTSSSGSGSCEIIKTAAPSSINKDNIACDGGGSIMITYTVTDNCGNTYPDVVCIQSVSAVPVPDQPVCPTLMTLTCVQAANATTSDYENITSTSGSGSCLITKTGVPSSIDRSNIACDGSGTISITYTVTDNCGNTYADVVCEQSVEAAPIPAQPACPTLQAISCTDAAAAQTSDYNSITAVSGSGICMITKTGVPSSIDKSQIACDGSGLITITYSVTDNCGNTYPDVECDQVVNAAPIPDQPACPALGAITCSAAAAAEADDYMSIISSSGSGSCLITKTGVPTSIDRSSIACDGSGSITIIYTVTDNCGRTYADVECMQSVSAAPVPDQPSCPSLDELSCSEAAAIELSNYSNITSTSGVGICEITKTGVPTSINRDNIACDGGGSIFITYTVTDNCGNSYADVVCEQSVMAVPIPDQPTCPSLQTLTCSQAANAIPTDYPDITSVSGSGSCIITKTGVPSSIDKSQIACDGSGTISITYSVTDNCGNSYDDVVCEQSVSAAPVPSQPACPSLTTITCTMADNAQPGDYPNITTTAGAGACVITKTGVPSSIDKSQIACDGSGLITITYTVTDNCNNTYPDVECVQQVSAPPAPSATPPTALTIDCDEAPPSGTVLTFSNGLSGTCGIEEDVTGIITGDHDECGGSYVETWTFTDDCQRETMYQRVISVRTVAPSFNELPSNIEISCIDLPLVEGQPTVMPTSISYSNGLMGTCDISGDVTGVISGTLDCCGGSVLTETWTYEFCNIDGRRSLPTLSYSRTITILGDSDPPFIGMCPANLDLGNISGVPTLANLPPAYSHADDFLATDNNASADDIVVSYADSGPSQNGCVFNFERLYTLMDPCGMTSQCIQLMTISNDLSLPTLKGVPGDTVVACEVAIEDIPWPDVSAHDQFGDDIPVNRREVRGNAGCGGAFYERIFSTDGTCGNTLSAKYTIRFEDDVPPQLEVPADTTLACDEEVPEPLYNASDNCSGVSVSYHEEITDVGVCERNLVRTWTARDGCGNSITKTQQISIRDFAPPVIRIVNEGLHGIEEGAEVITYNCDPPQVSASDIEVTDDCCVDISSIETFDRLVASHTCDVFGYYRKWLCGYTVSDGVGNETTFTFHVLQYDTIAPELQGVPSNMDLTCGEEIPEPAMEVLAFDNCQDGSLDVKFAEDIFLNPEDTNQLAIIRKWAASDECGNVTTAEQLITICGFDPTGLQRSIGNVVWLDLNGDGLQDSSERGLDGVDVLVYKTDSLGENKNLWSEQKTKSIRGQSGLYGFMDLPVGHYVVEIIVPAGLSLTTVNQGDNRFIDSDFSGARAQSPLIVVGLDATYMDVDAGLILEPNWRPNLGFSGAVAAGCLHAITADLGEGQGISTMYIQIENEDGFVSIDSATLTADAVRRELSLDLDNWTASSEQKYRVQLVTTQGFVWNSEPITLDSECANSAAEAFPNPAQSSVFFQSMEKINQADFRVVIRDALGHTFVIKNGISFPTDRLLEIELAELPPGHYTIQVSSGQSFDSANFVKM